MSYLYDELPAESRSAMSAHLDSCSECREQMQTWRSASRSLDRFHLPARRKVLRNPVLVRWAMAAALIGFAALGVMRMAVLQGEVNQLRADLQGGIRREIEASLRLELAGKMREDLNGALADWSDRAAKSANTEAQNLIGALAQRLETERLSEQQATLAVLQKLNARHTQDYGALRKELETVAVLTEAGLQRAQNQIATLAYSPVADSNKN
jgi:anti-sigma factor RsiW